jgi:hypothetical protein
VRYLDFEIKSDIRAKNPFIGSTIRGALGKALKKSVCINPKGECEGCFLASNCIYYSFYEEKNRFLNYRLDFNLYPEYFNFKYILFNEAIDKYRYLLLALESIFKREGIGRDREKSRNLEILYNGEILYSGGDFKRVEVEPKEFTPYSSAPYEVKLKLITPLRLKRKGRFLKSDNLDIKDILISILGKKAFYDKEEKGVIEKFPKIIDRDLVFKDFSRYSNRQNRRLKIGGVVGEMRLSDITLETYNLLKYGEITGVGKLNSFGLGKIEIEDLR